MRSLVAALLLCAAAAAAGEQVRRIDGYEIHYNAFRADFLPAAMSAKHGLTRAADRALLNVTVLRPRSDATLEAIEAEVSATVARDGASPVEVRLRPVREPGSVSYIGSFRLDGDDAYRFELTVKPFGASRAHVVRFRQVVQQ